MTTKTLPEKTVRELPEAIRQGIVDGHIDHQIESVKIAAKSSPTGKDEEESFDALYALDAQGMAILCNGKIEPKQDKPAEGEDTRTDEQRKLGACDHFNYGFILGVRQAVRARLESRLEGPEKSIEKAVKAGVAAGIYDSESEGREAVVATMKSKGKLPADYGVKA
jgi:hypothetical protein